MFRKLQLTAFGALGLDMAWAPHTPFSKVPLTCGVGAVVDKVIALNGQPVVRPVLTLLAGLRCSSIDSLLSSASTAVEARAVATTFSQQYKW